MLSRPVHKDLPPVDDLFAPIKAEPAVGVAVSGGPDSVALMLLAADWGRRHDKRVVIYSVDHRLRCDAAKEVRTVVREAEALGLECRALAWQGAKPQSGIQAAARLARYRLIGAAMREDGVGILMTAHHREDQAETVLMRLAHGSGIGGLAGMRAFSEVEGVPVFRPLLEVPRAALEAVVAHAPIVPVTDPSNVDPRYERARWRALLPDLATEGLDAGRLARFAARAARADAALERYAKAGFAELARFGMFGEVSLDMRAWRELPEEIGNRVLLRAIDWSGGATGNADLGQLEILAGRLRSESGEAQATLGGAQIVGGGDAIVSWREAGRIGQMPEDVQPGQVLVWDKRFKIANSGPGPIRVAPAFGLTRLEAEKITGQKIAAPMAMVRAAPLVTDVSGQVAALGCHCLAGDITINFARAGNNSALSEL